MGRGPEFHIDGVLLSSRAHATITDAAYEITVAAYRAGRARHTDNLE